MTPFAIGVLLGMTVIIIYYLALDALRRGMARKCTGIIVLPDGERLRCRCLISYLSDGTVLQVDARPLKPGELEAKTDD